MKAGNASGWMDGRDRSSSSESLGAGRNVCRDSTVSDGVPVSRCASEPPQPPELIKNIIYFEHHPQTACVGGRAGGTWRIFCV
jgi:hypothetical protein